MVPPQIPHPLDDEDDIAWHQLADSLRPPSSNNNSNSNSNTPETIHPLSRICQLRARAYSELGHPLRANLYWNRALQIDPWCVLALEGLLETTIQSPARVVDSVLMAMAPSNAAAASRDAPAGSAAAAAAAATETPVDDGEWLRALYLARVCTAAPNTAAVLSSSAAATEGPKPSPERSGDDPMEDDDDAAAAQAGNNNNDDHHDDDGNGDENMGGSSSFALTPHHRSDPLTVASRARNRSVA
eukprot:jgi/Psemu1/178177/e_gw1.3.136.1